MWGQRTRGTQVIGVSDDVASWPAHIHKADLVLEAIFEDLKVKQDLVRAGGNEARHLGASA